MSKDFYNDVYRTDHPSQYGGGADGMPERSKILAKNTSDWLSQTGLATQYDAEILEIGCGMAFLADLHPGWHGAEYSATAVARVKDRDGQHANIHEEDAQCLSFSSNSFDGVFSWAVLEHVPNPDNAFQEIDRVLRAGGHGLIAPAWNCRPWTVKKILQRPLDELAWNEKLERWFIPFRELLMVRAFVAIPGRIWGEVKLAVGCTSIPLRYKPLQPRWDLIEKYGHISDDDAVADIDLHAGICFFRSRGYEIISHPTMLARLVARHEPLVIRKRTK